MAYAVVTVPFRGDELIAIEGPNGEHFVPIRPICERLGLAWQPQYRKLSSNPGRWSVTMMMTETGAGERNSVCIPLSKVAAWLATIAPNRVKPELKDLLIAYQNEADEVLDRHFRMKALATADELVRLGQKWERLAAFACMANPLYARIAMAQKAGFNRFQMPQAVKRPPGEVFAIISQMEQVGAISMSEWSDEQIKDEVGRDEPDEKPDLPLQA